MASTCEEEKEITSFQPHQADTGWELAALEVEILGFQHGIPTWSWWRLSLKVGVMRSFSTEKASLSKIRPRTISKPCIAGSNGDVSPPQLNTYYVQQPVDERTFLGPQN
jgi:hypothetical protein